MDNKYLKVTRVPGIIRRVWFWEFSGVEYYFEASWHPNPHDHRRMKMQRIVNRNSGMRR